MSRERIFISSFDNMTIYLSTRICHPTLRTQPCCKSLPAMPAAEPSSSSLWRVWWMQCNAPMPWRGCLEGSPRNISPSFWQKSRKKNSKDSKQVTRQCQSAPPEHSQHASGQLQHWGSSVPLQKLLLPRCPCGDGWESSRRWKMKHLFHLKESQS